MPLGMFAKQAANTLASVLGTPLHVELIDTTRHPQCLCVCIQVDVSFSYPQSIPYVIDEGLKETAGELKFTYTSKAPSLPDGRHSPHRKIIGKCNSGALFHRGAIGVVPKWTTSTSAPITSAGF